MDWMSFCMYIDWPELYMELVAENGLLPGLLVFQSASS